LLNSFPRIHFLYILLQLWDHHVYYCKITIDQLLILLKAKIYCCTNTHTLQIVGYGTTKPKPRLYSKLYVHGDLTTVIICIKNVFLGMNSHFHLILCKQKLISSLI
jgi:hypothetical protein